jgi:hypothetical protein
MSSTLSAVEPDQTFFGLEPLICDAENMVNVLYGLIDEHFSRATPPGGYVIHDEDASRIFFIAGMANAMTMKLLKAYYVAHENDALERAAQ